MTPLTSLDWIFSPISYLAMTHNLCVECESAFVPVCIWVHVRWGGWEREWALMQCFPTLPLPPPPLPSSSSLLCTVDDSDPGQSSETWGERLVPPCRIYAGNRCSSIPAPVSSTSHVTHFAPLCCCKHTCTCVCFHSAWWWGGGSREVLSALGWLKRMLSFSVPFSNLMLVICFSACRYKRRRKTMSLLRWNCYSKWKCSPG